MLPQGIDADRQGHQQFGGRYQGQHAHARQHHQRADLIEAFRGERIEQRQDQNQQKSGQLPEKLCQAPLEFAHDHDVRQVVVDDAFIDAVTQAHGQDGKEKPLESGLLPKHRFDLFHPLPFPRAPRLLAQRRSSYR